MAFFERLQGLGVEPQAVEDWVSLCRKLASPEHPAEKVVDAAITLIKAEGEAGVSYELLPQRFQERLGELAQLGSSIDGLQAKQASTAAESKGLEEALTQKRKSVDAEKRRLDEELKEHLQHHTLTLEKVELISKIVPEEMRRAGLGPQEMEKAVGQIRAFSTLAQATFRVEERKRVAAEKLAQAVQAKAEAEKAVVRLSSSAKSLERKLANLNAQAARTEKEVKDLLLEKEPMQGDIDLVKRWMSFMSNPREVDQQTFDALVADFQDLMLRRMGTYETRDIWGRIIWKTKFPRAMSEVEITEDIRRRTLEVLLPIAEKDYYRGLRIVYNRCGWTADTRRPILLAKPSTPGQTKT